MGVSYYVVIEKEQYEDYLKRFNKNQILVLPEIYHTNYDTFDEIGQLKSQGPGPARNYAWDHSIKNGFSWHWVMDDNINGFYRFHENRQIKLADGLFFKSMEDFVLRYENVSMAGPNYYMFIPRKAKCSPLIFNTRIYSCNLIRNDVPYRWRGRYNEDTDLSLRMLKDGWCTIQFNTLLQQKIATQTIKGGNDERFYSKEGTYPKSEMLKRMHPEITKIVYKFSRWHHTVNYTPFKKNILIKKKELTPLKPYNLKIIKNDKI